jgi:hypothetical protein
VKGVSPRVWLVTGAAAVLGAGLLVAALLLDPADAVAPTSPRAPRIADAADLPMPQPLRPDEATGGGRPIDQQGVSLEQGAWVQVADETGRLAQQYSASRIDPERDKWMRMEEPRAVLYPRDGRVITLRSRRGRLRVPDRALESGRLDEQVVIRVYTPSESARVDLSRDVPSMVIHADEALFDSRLGEIRCDRRVDVVSEQLRFEGEGLTMLLLEDGRTIERLTVERPLSPIRITRRLEEVAMARPESTGRGPRATEPVRPDPAPAPEPSAARFYRLDLEKAVRVVRDGPKGRTVITGDTLASFFSMDGASVGHSLTRGMDAALGQLADARPQGGGATMPAALLSMAMAAGQPVEERTEIHYQGRLTMVLSQEAAEQVPSRDDVRVDIAGERVRLDDQASGARIDCGLLRYVTGVEAVTLEGSGDRRFVLMSPRLDVEARSLQLDRSSGRGVIQGAGRMRLGGADGAAVEAVAAAPAAAVQGQGSDVPLGGGDRTVLLQWSREVVLAFEPGTQAQHLRQADFRGDVVADADEVRMESGRLVVDCVARGPRDAVTRLLADEGAKATQRKDGSTLTGRRVELFLEPLENGSSRPRELLAEGSVEARDGEQVLWTEAMACDFVPADGAKAQLREMRSRGAVQALVSRDARVWATAMDADPATGKVRLRGPDLLLARGNVVADGMAELEMDDRTGEGSSPGPGRVRSFLTPVSTDEPRALPWPELPPTPQMEATWGDGFVHQRIDPFTTAVQLGGGVVATASRTPRDRDDLKAVEVLMTFVRPDGPLARAARAEGRGELGGQASDLRRVRAIGDVDIENRGWFCDDRSDEPRLLRLQGQDVTYDLVTGEADVPTPGSLLIFDRDDEGAKAAPPSLFDSRGTTRFRWARRLLMQREGPPGRFRIDLLGDVELVHAGLRAQDTLTLTCDVMEAFVERLEDGAPVPPTEARPVDLGGPVRLLRTVGVGRVFVRSPEADAECDIFDYDLRTRIATLSARPGRQIKVMQKGPQGQPSPIRCESAMWDMESGRIRIVGAGGAGLR